MSVRLDALLSAAMGGSISGFGPIDGGKQTQFSDKIKSASDAFKISGELANVIDRWREVQEHSHHDYYNLLREFMIRFTIDNLEVDKHSCNKDAVQSIYGNQEVKSFTGFPYQLTQLSNHRRLFIEMFSDVANERKVNEAMIHKYHMLLEQGCLSDIDHQRGELPGCYKNEPHWADEHGYVGAPPGLVDSLIKELVKSIDSIKILDDNTALAIISYFHCKFENIQPFYNGNGRVGRMLMNFMLMRYGFPPIYIGEGNSAEYFRALYNFNTHGDFVGFMKCMTTAIIYSTKLIRM